MDPDVSLSAYLRSTASRRNVEEHVVIRGRVKVSPSMESLRGKGKKCAQV